jgi:hypothetical protein
MLVIARISQSEISRPDWFTDKFFSDRTGFCTRTVEFVLAVFKKSTQLVPLYLETVIKINSNVLRRTVPYKGELVR